MSTNAERIAKYEIVEEAGRGGFAVVYKAWDPMLKRHVAIKVLHEHLSQDSQMVARFHREAQGAAALRHPHIVVMYEIGQSDEGLLYIAMEYVPGLSLHELLEQQGVLSPAQTLAILEQVGSALTYAHGQGIVHRDVKPHNIMVEWQGDGCLHTVLTDFGLVKMLKVSGALVTEEGIGSPAYMAPEQVPRGRGEIGPATDIYALGVTAYQMLTGCVPFESSTDIYGAQLNELPPDPSAMCPSVSTDVAAVLLKCLEKDPADRYTSAQEMVATLRDAMGFVEPSQLNVSLDLPEMVSIPAGSFWMGGADGDPEAQPNERPRHEVSTWAYEIAKYPVTNAQYEAFVQATGCTPPPHWPDASPPPGKTDHPVVCVGLHDAQAYCHWLGQVTRRVCRLPSEAEWEKAARGSGPDARRYPWGDSWSEGMCNTVESGVGDTTPVDEFEPTNVSRFGAVDMAGNVWEWTESPYWRYDGSGGLGMLIGPRYVVRGGAWSIPYTHARVSCRGRYGPEKRATYLGFRVVFEAD
jgi:serine/threonine-protein kinase